MDNNNMNNEQNNFYQDNTADVNVQAEVVNNTVETTNKADALAIIGLVCGILSIVLACCTSWPGAVVGIAGIIFSVMSKKKNGKTGMATAGMICSIIGVVFAVVYTIVIMVIGGVVGMAALESGMYY